MSDKKPQDNIAYIAMPVCPYCKTVMEVTRYEAQWINFQKDGTRDFKPD